MLHLSCGYRRQLVWEPVSCLAYGVVPTSLVLDTVIPIVGLTVVGCVCVSSLFFHPATNRPRRPTCVIPSLAFLVNIYGLVCGGL